MQKELNRLAETCRKLTMAIQNIERNRVRFPHVDDYELTDRKTKLSAVDKVRGRLAGCAHIPPSRARTPPRNASSRCRLCKK